MEKIIAGNFQTSVQADRTRQALLGAGFDDDDICVYHNNPPGQHGADPLGAVAGAGVGAYTGSFGGAMMGAGEDGKLPPQRRPAGIMVAVRLEDRGRRDSAIATMSEQQPVAIEEAEGKWENGEWSDFDPVAAPRIVWRANGNSEK